VPQHEGQPLALEQVRTDRSMTEQQTVTGKKTRGRFMFYLGIAVVGIFLLVVATLLFQVEDWSRDLSTNFAETSKEAKDPRLHPVVTSRSTDEVNDAIEKFVANHASWSSAELPADNSTLQLVRTSKLMRYKDDVTVTLSTLEDGGTLIEAKSQSRVGKGDFGQNPRNLRMLLEAMRTEETNEGS
jgi:uncharacterized protein (DUF1499 family)